MIIHEINAYHFNHASNGQYELLGHFIDNHKINDCHPFIPIQNHNV